jgi:DNA-binding CsgD family transcriptional regulator
MVKNIVLRYPGSAQIIFDLNAQLTPLVQPEKALAGPVKEIADVLWGMTMLENDYEIDICIKPLNADQRSREPVFEILDTFYRKNRKLVSLVRYVAEKKIYPEAGALEYLTPMQRKILRLVRDGYSYTEIADKLCISPHTVNGHRKNGMKVLGVTNIKELLSFMARFEKD